MIPSFACCSPRPQVLDWKRKALVCRCVALENALLGLDDEVASLAYSLFHRGETNVLSRADNCATVMKKVYAHDDKSLESSLRCKKKRPPSLKVTNEDVES